MENNKYCNKYGITFEKDFNGWVANIYGVKLNNIFDFINAGDTEPNILRIPELLKRKSKEAWLEKFAHIDNFDFDMFIRVISDNQFYKVKNASLLDVISSRLFSDIKQISVLYDIIDLNNTLEEVSTDYNSEFNNWHETIEDYKIKYNLLPNNLKDCCDSLSLDDLPKNIIIKDFDSSINHYLDIIEYKDIDLYTYKIKDLNQRVKNISTDNAESYKLLTDIKSYATYIKNYQKAKKDIENNDISKGFSDVTI
jgi:hypothetical protein